MKDRLKSVIKAVYDAKDSLSSRATCWIMWRLDNLYMATRGDFDAPFWEFVMDSAPEGIDPDEDSVVKATGVAFKLAEYGYVNKRFGMRSTYSASPQEIHDIESRRLPDFTSLLMKERKTWEDWTAIEKHRENPLSSISTLYSVLGWESMMFCYYGGFKFVEGHLTKEDHELYPVDFVKGYEDVPAELLAKVNELLWSKEAMEAQSKEHASYLDSVKQDKFNMLKRHIGDKVKSFRDMELWQYFKVESIIEKAFAPSQLETVPHIHGGCVIRHVTKDCHASYVSKAVEICERILANPKESESNVNAAKAIITKLK